MSTDHSGLSPDLDVQDVETFIKRRFGDDLGDDDAEVRGGTWSRAYAFGVAGRAYIARFSTYAEDFEKDRIAAGYGAQPGAQSLPIPRVTEIGQALGGFYALSERASGCFLEELDEPQTRAALPSLFTALDAARHVDLTASTGFGVWNADSNAPHESWREALLDVAEDRPGSRRHGWRRRLEASPSGAGQFDEAFGHLHELVRYVPEERHLVHSDLDNRNVLVEEHRVTAIFDWGSSLYGDFLYDIAWLHFWTPWFPARAGVDMREEALRHYEALGLHVPQFDERLRCYEVYVGLDGLAYAREHGVHLRTIKPIESTFATMRLRQRATKGPGSRAAGLAMVHKLVRGAEERWRRINAPHLVALVRAGAVLVDGRLQEGRDRNQEHAA